MFTPVADGIGWWLTSSEHVLTEEVPAPPKEVRDFYCDLRNLDRLHPLIVAVRRTGFGETADSRTQTYRVRDRIPFGPFAVTVAYTARVHVPKRGDVLTEARQFPHVRLYGRVSFDAVDGYTRITERLTIRAPRPLAAVTTRTALGAHVKMLAGIAECLR